MIAVARTNAEAHLYMDLRPCRCGENRFPRTSAVVAFAGDLVSEYSGPCARCRAERVFRFRLPDARAPAARNALRFGGDQPSELLDPGEWLTVADHYARTAPIDGSGFDPGRGRALRQQLAIAVAALDEVLKFVPAGSDVVPASAFVTARGRSVYAAGTDRFRRGRLEAVRDTYRRLWSQLGAQRA